MSAVVAAFEEEVATGNENEFGAYYSEETQVFSGTEKLDSENGCHYRQINEQKDRNEDMAFDFSHEKVMIDCHRCRDDADKVKTED